MENFLSNEMAIVLIMILVTVMVAIIFLLISSKQFNIKNVDVELEEYLNQLYTNLNNASTRSSKEAQKAVETFTSQLQDYEGQQLKTKDGLNNFVKHIMSEMEGMKNHIASIQELSLEKEEKIRRYEAGYDQTNIKNFTKGLFRILATIKEEQAKEASDSLSEIQEDILILLENNGIEKIDITIGNDYKEYSKVAKVTTTEVTTDPQKDSTVKEVKTDGYLTQVDETIVKVLIPAEVIVYKLSTGVENV